MDRVESSATPAHPPPERGHPGEARAHPTEANAEAKPRETSACPGCEGEGYVPIDHRYDWTTGVLTITSDPCSACRGTGEVSAFRYGTGKRSWASGAGA